MSVMGATSAGSRRGEDAATFILKASSYLISVAWLAGAMITFGLPSPLLALGLTSTFPKAGEKASCPDPALRLRFDATPNLGTQGKLRLLRTSNQSEVFALDFKQLSDFGIKNGLSDPNVSDAQFNSWPWKDTLITRDLRVNPIALVGNEVIVNLRRARLQPGTEYEVRADAGIFTAASSNSPAIAAGEWKFTTGIAPNASATEWLIDGNGASSGVGGANTDATLCTVQGAMDALPARNGKAVTLRLKAGVYPELVRIKSNSPVTFVGEGREKSRIVTRNNEKFNAGTRLRAGFGIESNQVRLFDLAIENATPQGGSQAEALATWGDKLIVGRCLLRSYQDTFLANGRSFIYDSRIEGDVDYFWGSGPLFVHQSTVHSLRSGGYIVQPRNEQGQRGFVFNQCALTTASGVSGAFLGRNAKDAYPYGELVYNQCSMDGGYAAAGWKFDSGDITKILFAEYQTKNPQGGNLNVSSRQSPGRQLSVAEAQNYSRFSFVLGGADNWQPDTGGVGVGVVQDWFIGKRKNLKTKVKGFGFEENRSILQVLLGRKWVLRSP
jgi:pectin methylesterase-like acyl-CoA thioesterase